MPPVTMLGATRTTAHYVRSNLPGGDWRALCNTRTKLDPDAVEEAPTPVCGNCMRMQALFHRAMPQSSLEPPSSSSQGSPDGSSSGDRLGIS